MVGRCEANPLRAVEPRQVANVLRVVDLETGCGAPTFGKEQDDFLEDLVKHQLLEHGHDIQMLTPQDQRALRPRLGFGFPLGGLLLASTISIRG